jgi:putative MATE family efflux protein
MWQPAFRGEHWPRLNRYLVRLRRHEPRSESDHTPFVRSSDLPASVESEALNPDELVAETSPAAPPVVGNEDALIRSGKLAGKSMWAAIWIVALPVLLQQFMQACVGLVDKLIAGHLPHDISKDALDGIGLGSFVGWFVNIALMGLGVGGQAIIARAMGGGDRVDGARALGQSMTLAVVWGAIVGAAMWFMAAPLSWITNLTPGAAHAGETYVRIIALGMPFCGVMMVGTMCLHGAGEATKPFHIAVVVNIVNTIASWLLSGVAFRFGDTAIAAPLPIDPMEYGVFGIAAGTTLSYVVGALATWAILMRGVKDLRLEMHRLALKADMVWRVLRVGIPSFFEGLTMWGVQFLVMIFIGMASEARGGGGGLIGAHTITVQWESFSFLPGFAMGTAAGAVAGQFVGAGNARLARRAIWACTIVGMGIMGSLGILFMLFGTAFTRLISDDPIHLETVPQLLLVCGAVQVFFALIMVIRNGLRGVGDTRWVLGITFGSCFLIRLPAAYILGVVFDYGLLGIWIALCGELVIRGLLFLARFVWGRWDVIRV